MLEVEAGASVTELSAALGALLTSGGSGRVLFEKAAVRAIDEADRREYVATRSRNLSAGVYLMIVGAVMFASLFVF